MLMAGPTVLVTERGENLPVPRTTAHSTATSEIAEATAITEVLVTGAPGKVKGPIAGTGAEVWVNLNPKAYQDLAQRYLAGFGEV